MPSRSRREILRLFAVSATGAIARCASLKSDTTPSRTPQATPTTTPTRTAQSTPASTPGNSSECASTRPLSSFLQERRGETDACSERANTSFAIENERNEPVTVEVTVESDSMDEIIGATYSLEPNQRVVKENVVPAYENHSVSVTVDEESVTGSWDGVSCLRHGIAIQQKEIRFGYVELYGGRADGDHACFAGDSTALVIFNRPDNPSRQTVNVDIDDQCTGETFERTVDIDPDDFAEISEPFEVGDEVSITVEVEGGGSATGEFSGLCRGLSAAIQNDREIELRDYIA